MTPASYARIARPVLNVGIPIVLGGAAITLVAGGPLLLGLINLGLGLLLLWARLTVYGSRPAAPAEVTPEAVVRPWWWHPIPPLAVGIVLATGVVAVTSGSAGVALAAASAAVGAGCFLMLFRLTRGR
jgi:hypothetical protein